MSSQSIKIALNDVKTIQELHDLLAIAFDFPDYYGKNWDAFWDCITDLTGMVTEIVIQGWSEFCLNMTDSARSLLRCLNEWKIEDGHHDILRIYLIVKDRRVGIPDIISEPSFSSLNTKAILFSIDYLRRGIIAERLDGNYEVRIEQWQYYEDTDEYSLENGYWYEPGAPSLTDTLEHARQLAIDVGCKVEG